MVQLAVGGPTVVALPFLGAFGSSRLWRDGHLKRCSRRIQVIGRKTPTLNNEFPDVGWIEFIGRTRTPPHSQGPRLIQ